MGFENVFVEVAAMLAVVTIIGSVGLMLRQPLIVSFIAAGIILGPSVLGLVAATEPIELLAQMGIALLLFVVGLKLDLHIIRTMGTVALATGLGQVLFTSIFGFLIALALGMSPVGALYVGVALTFSSTIIIVKLLSDKKEIDALHGRIAVGFLIVQDIVVVLVMIGLTALGAGTSAEPGALATEMLWVVLKGTGMLLFIAALMKYVLPTLTGLMARSAELLILFAISWAVTMAAVGDALGFSKEVGAFLAGVSLGFLAGLTVAQISEFSLILSAFVLIGNPIIVMAVMGYMGNRKRTGFLAGLTVAQISEFSLILAALGLSLGHIDRETVGLITLVGLITISGSTYMILYSHRLYEWLSPAMSVFERRNAYRETEYDTDEALRPEFVVFGLGRYGCGIADQLMARGHKVLGIDIDPEVVRTQGSENMKVRFGDAEDPEFLGSLPLARTRWVINTARERDINMALLNSLRREAYVGKVALTAANARDAEILQRAGADLVLRPFADAAFQAVDWLLGSSESVQPS